MLSPYWNHLHGPLLVNTVCHGAGVLIFGTLSVLFAADFRRSRAAHHLRPACASALALVWNLGSLVDLVRADSADAWLSAVSSISYLALSALPAVLLHIALERHRRVLVWCGYAVSGASVALHAFESLSAQALYHHLGLIVITAGFGSLTVAALAGELLRPRRRAVGAGRLAASMALLLLSLSFMHLDAEHGRAVWLSELLLHHAALPLSLFVLLQDYRFLMLDTFVRVVSSIGLAAATVFGTWMIYHDGGLSRLADGNPGGSALLALGACVLLLAFASAHSRFQNWVTRVVFGRPDAESFLSGLRELRAECGNGDAYLQAAAERVATFLTAVRFELTAVTDPEWPDPGLPFPNEGGLRKSDAVPGWVAAVVPLRVPGGQGQCLLLGSRRGGRRYLSEDFQLLGRIAGTIAEEIARQRSAELQALAAEAELRALQSQINPHFLFNALNTLYGTIRRDNADARRLVLNLSDVLRFALRAEEKLILFEEELRIVRAYLEVEQVRLGAKLRIEIAASPESLSVRLPALSVQPLVENAVKHGVAPHAEPGYVRLSAKCLDGELRIEVANSGAMREHSTEGSGGGVGLENVRRRLALHYRDAGGLKVGSSALGTRVTLTVPVSPIPDGAGARAQHTGE